MIVDFFCKETRKIYDGHYSKTLPNNIQRTARRKLIYLDEAIDINDLQVPPGNRLEKLRGNRKGQWSIRINDQWRICFVWSDGNANRVEIVDYH